MRRVEWQSKSVATCCVAIILCGRTNENWISRSFDMQTEIWCDSIMHCNNERNNKSIIIPIDERFEIIQKAVSVLPYWNRHSAETALPRHPCQMFCERKPTKRVTIFARSKWMAKIGMWMNLLCLQYNNECCILTPIWCFNRPETIHIHFESRFFCFIQYINQNCYRAIVSGSNVLGVRPSTMIKLCPPVVPCWNASIVSLTVFDMNVSISKRLQASYSVAHTTSFLGNTKSTFLSMANWE